MPSSPARRVSRRTTRRLLKLASLGLAGLLAGLLSGCNASPAAPADTFVSSDSGSAANRPNLPDSLDARQIPALRHPPSARRLQAGSLRITGEPVVPNSRTGS
jgi:hypothetical protein